MVPNPEPDQTDEKAVTDPEVSGDGDTDDSPARPARRRRRPRRSSALVPSGPTGRIVPLPGVNVRTALQVVTEELTKGTRKALEAATAELATNVAKRVSLNETFARPSGKWPPAELDVLPQANRPVQDAVKSLSTLSERSLMPMKVSVVPSSAELVQSQLRAAAVQPALRALEDQRRLLLAPGVPQIGIAGREVLGLSASTELARTTSGLSEALFPSVTGVLDDLVRRVADLANSGGGFVQLGLELSTQVWLEIEEARAAAVRDDRAALRAFIARRLKLPRGRGEQRVLAVAEALLWLDLENLDADKAWGTLKDLERAGRDVRSRKLIGDTSINGKQVYYLDDMTRILGEEPTLDQCPRLASAESMALGAPDDFGSTCVGLLLERLEPEEKALVLAKGQTDGGRKNGLSWAKAAEELGLPDREGRRVAAKAKRLASEILRELEGMSEPTAVPR